MRIVVLMRATVGPVQAIVAAEYSAIEITMSKDVMETFYSIKTRHFIPSRLDIFLLRVFPRWKIQVFWDLMPIEYFHCAAGRRLSESC
jgi:hypothetical protein